MLLQENGGGEAAIQSAILQAQERALAAELAEAPARPSAAVGPRRGRAADEGAGTDSGGPSQVRVGIGLRQDSISVRYASSTWA